MKFLFYLAHPAHFHVFKHTIRILESQGHAVRITIKSKDVLKQLLDENGFEYTNIGHREKRPGRIGTLIALIKRNHAHLRFIRRWKPDVFVSTSAEFAPIARLLGIRTVSFFEDDLDLFPWYSRLLVPFLDLQVCPKSCSAGKWNAHPKTVKYRGNQELAYLSPAYFQPDRHKIDHLITPGRRHFIIRFSGLNAWHDHGIQGLNDHLARKVVDRLSSQGQVMITSERQLPDDLEKYRIQCPASLMQDLIYHCDMVVGDSQTMTAEAAVLGTPAIRINDFVGKLGYLKELEEYGLCHGFRSDQQKEFIEKLTALVADSEAKNNCRSRKEDLLRNSIDPTAFFVKLLTASLPWASYLRKKNEAISILYGNHA